MVGALFLLLVLQPFIGSGMTTVALVLLVICACFEAHFMIPKRAVSLLIIPAMMLVLGTAESASHSLRDVLKDYWYFIFPALSVFAGQMVARRIKRIEPILLAFVASGVVLSCWHLINFVAHRGSLGADDLNDIRSEVGSGYMLSAISPLILFLSGKFNISLLPARAKIVPIAIYCITISSVVLAMSRTITISLILSSIAGLGWLTAKRKGGLVIGGVVITAVLGLSAVLPEDVGTFLGKLARSREEVTFNNFNTTTDAIQYWRAYETLKGLQAYGDGNAVQKAVGLGFGKLVDIGFSVQLGATELREIPLFHNGYVYVLVKTGYVGLGLFFVYLAGFYIKGARSADSGIPEQQLVGGLTMAMTVTVLVSTFVIAGWFNPMTMCSVMLFIGTLMEFLEDVNVSRTVRIARPMPQNQLAAIHPSPSGSDH